MYYSTIVDYMTATVILVHYQYWCKSLIVV